MYTAFPALITTRSPVRSRLPRLLGEPKDAGGHNGTGWPLCPGLWRVDVYFCCVPSIAGHSLLDKWSFCGRQFTYGLVNVLGNQVLPIFSKTPNRNGISHMKMTVGDKGTYHFLQGLFNNAPLLSLSVECIDNITASLINMFKALFLLSGGKQ